MAVESYLGCISLRSGAVVTGFLTLVYNGFLICIFISCMQTLAYNNQSYNVIEVIYSILIALSVLHIVISIILLKTIVQNKRDMLIMWVIIHTASMIVGVLFTIGLACIVSPLFAFLFVGYVVFMYHTMVVHSLYYKTSEKQDNPKIESRK